MKYVITGGHVTPALAVIDALGKSDEVVFLGRRKALLGDKEDSFEYREITARKIPFIHLHAGKFNRVISLATLRELVLIPIGIAQAFFILLKMRPDVVLTFGGYIGLAASVAAWVLRVPLYVHEQTVSPGLANRLASRLATTTFITYVETATFFAGKTIVTGNPVRREVTHPRGSCALFDGLDMGRDVIFIMGGSLGSHSINVMVESVLSELTQSYTVLHQTGNVSEFDDHNRLKTRESTHYRVVTHVLGDDIGHVMQCASVFVGRSGANTVSELIALQKPSVLIPLPWAGGGEQRKHAAMLAEAKTAIILEQTEDPNKLIKAIQQAKHIKRSSFHTFSHEQDPARCIIQHIETHHKKKTRQ